MTRFAFITTALLATIALAEPIPYPPSVTSKPTDFSTKPLPFFEHKGENIQPTSTSATVTNNTNDTKELATRVLKAVRSVGELVSNPALARWDVNIHDGIGNGQDVYRMYWGAGRANEGWPTRNQWVSFENMFNNNKNMMFGSCSLVFQVPNNSGPEIGAIWNAIQQVATETRVDHRFILAVMLQESGGCVRAPTTTGSVRNPGLMQDHDGQATCNNNGVPQNPCPDATITKMIREGTGGTPSGDGLANCINLANKSTDQAFYRAARLYNSGIIHGSTRLECGIARHCYASDIANRLTGWVNARSTCQCDDNYASCGC